MNNVEISYLGKETRPAFILDDVKGADLFHVKAQKATDAARFVLKNVQQFQIEKSEGIQNSRIQKVAQLRL
ncbi:MAG: hypothetical protein WKF97_08545 [Chitinophagaceae bacterium]